MPALTRFYYGAISYLNVDQFAVREIAEMTVQMDEYNKAVEEANRRGG